MTDDEIAEFVEEEVRAAMRSVSAAESLIETIAESPDARAALVRAIGDDLKAEIDRDDR
jgi:hypothetical protein